MSTETGKEKEINGDKSMILYRLSQQDSALREIRTEQVSSLREIRAAIEARKADWKPLLGLFGIFMVALGASYWPLSNRIELLERSEQANKDLYQKDKEFMLEKLRAIDRELIWHFDNIKVRIGAVEQKQELWMKNKEPKP